MEKIIHQVWIGPYEKPTKIKEYMDSIRISNPQYTYMEWNDTNIPNMPKHIKDAYDLHFKNKCFSFATNVLKIFLLKEYGGLYVDSDVEQLEPIQNLDFSENDCYIYTENSDIFSYLTYFIGSKKDSPLFTFLYDSIDIYRSVFCHNSWYCAKTKEFLDIGNTATQNVLEEKCKDANISFSKVANLNSYFIHKKLNSWSRINMLNFQRGMQNYLK